MTKSNLNVVIIGAGMGGLCLAQGLKKAGIGVAVYERDEAPSSRTQGYRIHIDPQGSTALYQCLPEHLWAIFDATVGDFSQGFSVVTERLHELLSVNSGGGHAANPIIRHRSVSRTTLRHVLLAGLEDSVHFGKKFLEYEKGLDGGITAHFEDGSSAGAQVLVGADGVHSRVRKQYLPGAEPVDTGVVGIGGTIPLTDEIIALAPHQLLNGPVMVLPPSPCCLFMVMWKRSPQASKPLRLLGIEGPLPGDQDYLLIALGGGPDYFALPKDLSAVTGADLKETLRHSMTAWHPSLRKLIELVGEEEIFLNHMRTSRPTAAWNPSEVTLLGDAVHSMTPYRGIGGNIALKDAASLCSKLTEVHKGVKPLLTAIAEYEASMRKYGFAAVADSLRAMEQFTGQKRQPLFSIKKAGMRSVNAMLKLKNKLRLA